MTKTKINISLSGVSAELPQVHYGKVDAEPMDWKEIEAQDADGRDDDDDQELKQTPANVVQILGFDPLEKDE